MENITKSLTLNLDGAQTDQQIETREDDFESRFVVLDFLDRAGEFTIPNEAEIRANFRRFGGRILTFSSLQEDAVVSVNGNSVILRLPQAVLDREGIVLCDISFLEGGKKLTSESFRIRVNPAVGSSEAFSGDECVDVLSELISETNEAARSVETLIGEIRTKLERGDFNGADGLPGERGADGDDYVVTQADYHAIAQIVEDEISIPSSTSDLINDSGFLTLTSLPKYNGEITDGGLSA